MNTVIAGISGGIGLALASRLLGRDPNAVILGIARNASNHPGACQLQKEHSKRLHLVDTDVTQPQDLRDLGQTIPPGSEIRRIIYAIGVLHDEHMFPEKRLEDIDPQEMMRSYQVNTLGFLLLTRTLIPWLRHRQPKLIAAISAKVGSIGDNGFGGWYSYRCSKAALNMAIRNLAIETHRRMKPAIVVALHPGTTQTRLSEPFQQSLARLPVHTPGDTATNLWQVMDNLTPEDSGAFFSWDGNRIPW